jgi:hypothetical protein
MLLGQAYCNKPKITCEIHLKKKKNLWTCSIFFQIMDVTEIYFYNKISSKVQINFFEQK